MDGFQHGRVLDAFNVHELHHVTGTTDVVYFPNFTQSRFNIRCFQYVHESTFLDPFLRYTTTATAAGLFSFFDMSSEAEPKRASWCFNQKMNQTFYNEERRGHFELE